MENSEKSFFKFDGFKIIKSSFEMSDISGDISFKIGFDPSGKILSESNKFELKLNVLIEDEKNLFRIEIESIGGFTFDSNIKHETLSKMFYINAPAILFPYIRAYITTLSTLSGLQPIIIPTLNLSNLGKELEKNTITI